MALEPTSAAPSSASAAPAAAPAVATPAAAPVVEAAPAAAPTPVVESAPAAAPAVEAAKPVGDDVKPADAPAVETPAVEAAAEAKPADGEKPVEGAAVEPAADATPKAFEFKLPETVKADAATMSAYNNVLGKYGISQEAGQELIDFHANAIKATSDQMTQRQLDAWADTNKQWVDDFEKSAGNKRDTLLNDAKFAITDTIKDAKQRKALWDVLAFTGAGNHKDVINGLAAIGKRLRERSAPSPGAPLNGAKNGNPADRRYGGNNKSQG